MKQREDRTRCSDGARRQRQRWSTALVILVAALSLGTPPALSGEAVKEGPPTASMGRARPLDVVKASVSRVLAIVQPPYVVASDGGQRRMDLRRVAQGLFDLNEMARRPSLEGSLGPGARGVHPALHGPAGAFLSDDHRELRRGEDHLPG